MPRRLRLASIALLVVALAGCSMWDDDATGVTYTFVNHCGEDVQVAAVGSGEQLALSNGETLAVVTFDQEPDQAFVVSRPDGTDGVQVSPGTTTIDIEGDHCPTDT